MRHEIKKVCKIVDELTTFFLCEDTNEVDFKVISNPDHTIIRIVDYNTHFPDSYIDYLRVTFNSQRQTEIEEYYWTLAGNNDEENEMTLVGAMIDSATIEKRDGNLYLELIRKCL